MEWKTDDLTAQFEAADISQNRAMAACSYLGLLVLVPFCAGKSSGFARFHANQGLALLVAGAAYNVAAGMLAAAAFGISWVLYPAARLVQFAGLFFPVLAVMGIYNAANGKAKELPLIGKLCLLWKGVM